MNRSLFVIVTVIFIFAFTCPVIAQPYQQPAPAAGQGDPSVGIKILDVAVVRPLCLAGSIVSTAAFLVISPFALVIGVVEPAARAMVEAPWRFTSFRYVGQFDHYTDEKPIMGVWDLSPSNY
jgi:hypothetical protein